MSDKQRAALKGKTIRMTWARYIARCLSRAAHLENSEEQRANDIRQMLVEYVHKQAPSGSGIDSGTKLTDESKVSKIVLIADFHHMDEYGAYDGWTNHKIVVTPTFDGIDIRVTGRDRNQIKDFLGEMYYHWLGEEADHPALIEYS